MENTIIDTPEKMGWELLGQCLNLKVEEKLENTFATFTLNFLGVAYSLQVPKHEMNDPKNWRDAWGQLITEVAIKHELGASKFFKDGSRDLTDVEMRIMEESRAKDEKNK